MSQALAFFGLPGGSEWIIIGLAALLIFGRRLPDVARSVGKSIVEFKKGLRDMEDEIKRDDRDTNRLDGNRDGGSSHQLPDQSERQHATGVQQTQQPSAPDTGPAAPSGTGSSGSPE